MTTTIHQSSTIAHNSIAQAAKQLSFISPHANPNNETTPEPRSINETLDEAILIIYHVVKITPLAALHPLSSYDREAAAALFSNLSQITIDCLILCDRAYHDYTVDDSVLQTFKDIIALANDNKNQLCELFSGTRMGYADKLSMYADFIRTTQMSVNHLLRRCIVSVDDNDNIPFFVKQYNESSNDAIVFDNIPFLSNT